MMDIYEEKQIQELPLSVPLFRKKVEDFLKTNGLRLEKVDLYMAIQDADEQILAGGGLAGDTIKCIAVSEKARSEGLAAPLISRLIAIGAERGYSNIKVFTKPENRAIFESLGFRLLASASIAILLENGNGLREYLQSFPTVHSPSCPTRSGISIGVTIINANPFSLGHRYLIEKALEQVSRLYVIVVKEDVSRFPYAERLATVRAACADLKNVTVCEGSSYQISAATFPTYFLKELTDASETQMRLDLDLFCRHIAPALGATVRFVGTEPTDALTARYNALMKEILPSHGIRLVEIPRLDCHARPSLDCHARPDRASDPVSASAVRAALDAGHFGLAASMVPAATMPSLLADRAVWALRQELALPGKPGLVGPDSPGAHRDMDFATMEKGITALRPYFYELGYCHARPLLDRHARPDRASVSAIGKEAEEAMLEATGGVNTHQGAIFSIGLFIASVTLERSLTVMPDPIGHLIQSRIAALASAMPDTLRTREWAAMGVNGPLALARGGYKDLFDDWLPYYRTVKDQLDGMHKTLLRIMATLDDTCIIRRAGLERAQKVKEEARTLLNDYSAAGMQALNEEFCREGISPGGAADMLALTLFADGIEVK